jgi:hypothetical protein
MILVSWLAVFSGLEIFQSAILLVLWFVLCFVLLFFGVKQIIQDKYYPYHMIALVLWCVIGMMIAGQQGGAIVTSYALAGLGAYGVARQYNVTDALYYAGWVLLVAWIVVPEVRTSKNVDALWFGLWLIAAEQRREKYAIIAAAIMLVVIGSRAGIVVAGVGLLILHPPKITWWSVSAVILVLVVLVLARLDTVMNRYGTWLDAIAVLRDTDFITWLTGRGPGWVYMSQVLLDRGRVAPHAHNAVLQIILEQGLIGLGLVGWAAWDWIKRKAPGYVYLVPLLVVGLVDYPWDTGGIIVFTCLCAAGGYEKLSVQ